MNRRPNDLTEVVLTDKDLMPEKDYDMKKAGIISQVVGKPVVVEYGCGANYCYETKNKTGFVIHKASPKIVGINGNTATNHELAHVLFGSFDARAYKTMHAWAKNISLEMCGHDIENASLAEKYEGHAYSIYTEAYNIIEDQRIESMWSKIYLGNKKDFIETRKKLGKELKAYNNPSAVLLAKRFFRDDLVKQSDYTNVAPIIHDVEGKEIRATVIVLRKVKPYLDEIIKKFKKDQESLLSAKTSLFDKKKFEAHKPRDERMSPLEEAVAREDIRERSSIVEQDVATMPQKKLEDNTRQNGVDMKEVEEYTDNEMGVDDDDEDSYEDSLEEEKELADATITMVKQELAGNGKPPLEIRGKTKYKQILKKQEPSKINVNSTWINNIKRMFKSYKEKPKQIISSEGYDLDVGSFIDMKSTGYGDCFIEDIRKNGLSIVLSIDGSGSMRGTKNIMVQRICGTIFKAIEDIPNIDMKCITWSSDSKGLTWLKKYEKYDDLKHLNEQPLGYTPTHVGISVGSEELSKMSGRRKLLILITDGAPQYHFNGRRVALPVILKTIVKAYKMSTKKTPNMLMVGVGYGTHLFANLFKGKFISCTNEQDLEKFMMKTIRKEIQRCMSR